MKTIAILSSIVLLFSCSKSNNHNSYKVKYVVTGESVDQFKISQDVTDEFVKTPFSGTKDTTVYVQLGAILKLDAKASNHNLVGFIYVNDALVDSATDSDIDGDGKTEVKLQYTVGAQ